MSDFDEELEEDLEDTASEDEEADDFEDPQQTTAALTMEINKLRQKNEVLRQFNVKQKDRYKDEVRSFLSPLIQKYKDLQSENDFLKRQIKEIGQSKDYLSKAKEIGENGNHEKEDFVKLMENAIKEKEHEIAVLGKMVKTLEEESFSLKRDVAELPELKESLKQKSEAYARLEEEKFDLSSKIEAKENLAEKYLKQINDLETNMYVLNKRISERAGQFEAGKVSEYETKLEKANEKIEKLNQKIHNLEKQLNEYQQTMSSLEEELEEEEFLKGTSSTKSVVGPSPFSLEKEDDLEEEEKPAEVFDYTKLYKESDSDTREESLDEMDDEYISSDELPSDDDLLAEDIELEEMSLEDEPAETPTLELDEPVLEELSADDDDLSIDNDADLVLEELPLDDDDLGLELDQDSDESFDDLPVEDLLDDESFNPDIDLSKPEEAAPPKKHFDLRSTNIENVKILSELKLETSPFKAESEMEDNDVSRELFDDELPVDDLLDEESDADINPIDDLPIDIFDEDKDNFDSVEEENKSVKS